MLSAVDKQPGRIRKFFNNQFSGLREISQGFRIGIGKESFESKLKGEASPLFRLGETKHAKATNEKSAFVTSAFEKLRNPKKTISEVLQTASETPSAEALKTAFQALRITPEEARKMLPAIDEEIAQSYGNPNLELFLRSLREFLQTPTGRRSAVVGAFVATSGVVNPPVVLASEGAAGVATDLGLRWLPTVLSSVSSMGGGLVARKRDGNYRFTLGKELLHLLKDGVVGGAVGETSNFFFPRIENLDLAVRSITGFPVSLGVGYVVDSIFRGTVNHFRKEKLGTIKPKVAEALLPESVNSEAKTVPVVAEEVPQLEEAKPLEVAAKSEPKATEKDRDALISNIDIAILRYQGFQNLINAGYRCEVLPKKKGQVVQSNPADIPDLFSTKINALLDNRNTLKSLTWQDNIENVRQQVPDLNTFQEIKPSTNDGSIVINIPHIEDTIKFIPPSIEETVKALAELNLNGAPKLFVHGLDTKEEINFIQDALQSLDSQESDLDKNDPGQAQRLINIHQEKEILQRKQILIEAQESLGIHPLSSDLLARIVEEREQNENSFPLNSIDDNKRFILMEALTRIALGGEDKVRGEKELNNIIYSKQSKHNTLKTISQIALGKWSEIGFPQDLETFTEILNEIKNYGIEKGKQEHYISAKEIESARLQSLIEDTSKWNPKRVFCQIQKFWTNNDIAGLKDVSRKLENEFAKSYKRALKRCQFDIASSGDLIEDNLINYRLIQIAYNNSQLSQKYPDNSLSSTKALSEIHYNKDVVENRKLEAQKLSYLLEFSPEQIDSEENRNIAEGQVVFVPNPRSSDISIEKTTEDSTENKNKVTVLNVNGSSQQLMITRKGNDFFIKEINPVTEWSDPWLTLRNSSHDNKELKADKNGVSPEVKIEGSDYLKFQGISSNTEYYVDILEDTKGSFYLSLNPQKCYKDELKHANDSISLYSSHLLNDYYQFYIAPKENTANQGRVNELEATLQEKESQIVNLEKQLREVREEMSKTNPDAAETIKKLQEKEVSLRGQIQKLGFQLAD
ncbi:MAG: hypothetical protein QNJ31_08875, partial [Candidatus Caenarcaniphilales bacterium]|nr:hypothetical protein [Candidatus Caenarcaniphilales bacterium]